MSRNYFSVIDLRVSYGVSSEDRNKNGMFPYIIIIKSPISLWLPAKLIQQTPPSRLQRLITQSKFSQSPTETLDFPPKPINGGNQGAMRCKIHPSDPGAGVCATCLRERLTTLSSAVAKAGDADYSPESRRNLGRSASPKSFGLRPADPDSDGGGGQREHVRRFSFLSFLLTHSKHMETNSDSEAAKPSRSRSWLSSMIRGRRVQKRKKRTPPRFVMEERVTGRGLSPAEKEVSTDFDSESGYHTDPLPTRQPEVSNYSGRQRRRNCRLKGFSMCFSPLMRPSPGKRKNQAPSEVGFSGELRGGFNTQRNRYGGASSGGSSFLGPNRSRKIADFGKFR